MGSDPNKVRNLYFLYADYLVSFATSTAIGLGLGACVGLVLRPGSFRAIKFYAFLGSGFMGGMATHQSARQYAVTT